MVVGQPTAGECRWRARPVLAAVLTVAIWATPVVCSIGAAAVLRSLWVTTATTEATAYRWVAILGGSAIIFIGCERATHRALPLVILLKLPMVFPGRAPRRLSLAARTWSTGGFRRRIDEAAFLTANGEPAVAAEQLLMLAAVLGAHDGKTRRHAGHVRALTDQIAERLRLPEYNRDRLQWSALAHDVAKLTIPSDRPTEADALSEVDCDKVGDRPLKGSTLIAPLASWLGDSANIIAEHHEHFDGTGYPSGLTGNEIPLGARILAVADFYDFMTSRDGHGVPSSTKAARLQLAADAGARFDPVVVRAFLAVPAGRQLAPVRLTSLGTSLFGTVGPRLARVGESVGRVGVGAVVVATSVVALTAGQRVVVSASRTHLSDAPRQGRNPGPTGFSRPTFAGGGGGRPGGTEGAGTSTTAGVDQRPGVSSQVGGIVPVETRSTGKGTGRPGGQPATQGETNTTGPTTTVASGSTTPVPVTTVSGTSPTRSTTTTTTDPPPPPPVMPPTGLTGTSDCQVVVIVPEVSLSWTASPSAGVTGYVILRGPNADSLTYSGAVSGRTNTTYTDHSVIGQATTYWYEVEAVGGGSAASSSPISVTTPSFCVSAGTPQ